MSRYMSHKWAMHSKSLILIIQTKLAMHENKRLHAFVSLLYISECQGTSVLHWDGWCEFRVIALEIKKNHIN